MPETYFKYDFFSTSTTFFCKTSFFSTSPPQKKRTCRCQVLSVMVSIESFACRQRWYLSVITILKIFYIVFLTNRWTNKKTHHFQTVQEFLGTWEYFNILEDFYSCPIPSLSAICYHCIILDSSFISNLKFTYQSKNINYWTQCISTKEYTSTKVKMLIYVSNVTCTQSCQNSYVRREK